MKQAAIEDLCNSDRRLVGGKNWTFENLAQNYTNVFWFQTEAERTHFVSTLNETRLYQSYKVKFNERVSVLIGEAQYAKLDIEVERHRLVDEHNRLTSTYPQMRKPFIVEWNYTVARISTGTRYDLAQFLF